jgi:hypothetical protein
MAASQTHLSVVVSLAAVLAQVACQGVASDGDGTTDGSGAVTSGGTSSGGASGTGGSFVGSGGIYVGTGGDTGGTGSGGVTASGGVASDGLGSGGLGSGGLGSGGAAETGGSAGSGGSTAECPEYPHSPCGEGGCEVGDSYPGGTGELGQNGDFCLYMVTAGPPDDCDPAEPDMGVCKECFCDNGDWLCWNPVCP